MLLRKEKNPTENDEEHFFFRELNILGAGSLENETLFKLLIVNKWFPFPPEQ